jgi:predicted dinucleotide-binding enzyme
VDCVVNCRLVTAEPSSNVAVYGRRETPCGGGFRRERTHAVAAVRNSYRKVLPAFSIGKHAPIVAGAASVSEAAAAELVLLAVPWPAVRDVLDPLPDWQGRIPVESPSTLRTPECLNAPAGQNWPIPVRTIHSTIVATQVPNPVSWTSRPPGVGTARSRSS